LNKEIKEVNLYDGRPEHPLSQCLSTMKLYMTRANLRQNQAWIAVPAFLKDLAHDKYVRYDFAVQKDFAMCVASLIRDFAPRAVQELMENRFFELRYEIGKDTYATFAEKLEKYRPNGLAESLLVRQFVRRLPGYIRRIVQQQGYPSTLAQAVVTAERLEAVQEQRNRPLQAHPMVTRQKARAQYGDKVQQVEEEDEDSNAEGEVAAVGRCCFFCKEPGHIRENCTKYKLFITKKASQNQVAVADEGDEISSEESA
jgi:hypothetical protein